MARLETFFSTSSTVPLSLIAFWAVIARKPQSAQPPKSHKESPEGPKPSSASTTEEPLEAEPIAWKEHRLSAAIVVAFDFFLRTGEIFTLRRQDVEFFHHSASLQLLHAKSSGHQIHSERLLAWDQVAIQALAFLGT